jgi:hypothetical protein
VQLRKNLLPYYGTRRFITVFTQAFHCALSRPWSIQSILFHPIYLKSILILSKHLCLDFPTGLFPSGFSQISDICLSSTFGIDFKLWSFLYRWKVIVIIKIMKQWKVNYPNSHLSYLRHCQFDHYCCILATRSEIIDTVEERTQWKSFSAPHLLRFDSEVGSCYIASMGARPLPTPGSLLSTSVEDVSSKDKWMQPFILTTPFPAFLWSSRLLDKTEANSWELLHRDCIFPLGNFSALFLVYTCSGSSSSVVCRLLRQ